MQSQQLSSDVPVVRRRILGLALVALAVGFVALTVLSYTNTFTSTTTVYLVTDSAGNSLPDRADVKARGVLMGTVESTEARGDKVVLRMELKPDLADEVPRDATARLLPKTLFGESYVALQIPEGAEAGADHVRGGDTIYQDSSGNAVQIGDMLDSLLPILQAVPPQDLSVTLSTVNRMLSGQGEDIGRGVDQLTEITAQLTDRLPHIRQDLDGIADFARTYSGAAPDLIDALNNLRTTNKTVVDMQDQIRSLLLSGAGTAGSTADFIDRTRGDFVAVSAQSAGPLQLFAESSPAFGCTFEQFSQTYDRARDIVGDGDPHPGIRVTLELVNPRGRYLPNQDEPRWFEMPVPTCIPAAPPGRNWAPDFGVANNGAYQVPRINTNDAPTLFPPDPMARAYPDGARPQPGYLNSDEEQEALAQIYAAASGADSSSIPGWTTLIGAPSLRGNEVVFR